MNLLPECPVQKACTLTLSLSVQSSASFTVCLLSNRAGYVLPSFFSAKVRSAHANEYDM